MSFRLSLNANPFVNRFAEPDDLIAAIADGIGLGYLQLTHEFINPSWPESVARRAADAIYRSSVTRGVKITSLMTGPSGRLNHFGHPDADVRRHYVRWFEILADIAADIGCPAIGTQFAILTYRDFDDESRRGARLAQALDCWRAVADHAAARGLNFLFWEPMSVGRELGHTIQAAAALQNEIDAARLALPLKPMIDIDHGDVSSPDPTATDPYAWATAFATRAPIIHIKQSSMNKGGHWPFTAERNRDGRIAPDRLLGAIRAGGGSCNELCMEFSFREREPADRSVIAMTRESVEFWRPYVDTGRA
jgi:sugar phosphate isomerase/epimerase